MIAQLETIDRPMARPNAPERLTLRSFQCPGDIVVLTAAVRELHRQYPGRYETDVRTSVPAIWEHNPDITAIPDDDLEARGIDMHYPLVNQSNQRPVHFLEGYCDYRRASLGCRRCARKNSGAIST